MLQQESKTTLPKFVVQERAVLYARTSYDDRDTEGRNLAGQLEMCRKYAIDKGYHIVAELQEDDRGASGARIDLPQLTKVREMAQAGQINVLIVRELDRLSRNLAKQLIVEDELNRAGVKVEYVLAEYDDTPEGRFNKHIRATLAEYEREKIRERVIRGKRNKVKAGSVLIFGQSPYGYNVIEQKGIWKLEINPDEAKIVKLIFQLYIAGDEEDEPMSLNEITRKLSAMSVLTASDKGNNSSQKKRGQGQWYKTTVRGILKNETYAGTWHYGKTKRVNGKLVKNSDGDMIAVDVPAIIDRKTWELAQAKLKQNKHDSKRNRKYKYLLAGRIFCGECHTRMNGNTRQCKHNGKTYKYQYYCCPSVKRLTSRTCNAPVFRVNQVDSAVWNWLKSVISDPKYLEEKLLEYQTQQEEICAPFRERLIITESLLSENRTKLDRLLDLYLSGEFDKDLLIDRKTRLETTIKDLEREEAILTNKLQAETITPELIQDVLEFAAVVREEVDLMDSDFNEQRWLIEQLKVEATLTIENGNRIAYARCKLLGEEEPLLLASSTFHSQSSIKSRVSSRATGERELRAKAWASRICLATMLGSRA